MDSKKNRHNLAEQQAILVTVCVTSYNRPEGIDRTLVCLTQQTHKNLEIIVADDCSPDKNVSKVIASHAERDQRIKYYIQEANLFYLKNLKFILDKSAGNFIMWCDDDDWYDPTYIQKCLSALLQNEMALTAFPYYSEADEFQVLNTTYPNQSKLLERLTNKNTYFRLLAYLFAYDGFGYCNIYYGLHRKEILSWFNPERFGMGVDADVGIKLISLRPLALVREHLFKKTVANKKEYIRPALHGKEASDFKIIYIKIKSTLINCIRKLAGHYKVLRLDHAIFIAIFSPFWIASVIIIYAGRFLNPRRIRPIGINNK